MKTRKIKYSGMNKALTAALFNSPMAIVPSLQALAVPINDLTPDPENANSHNAENLAVIKHSLATIGQVKTITILEDGTIKAGNGTWLAAKEIGATHIAVSIIPKDLEKFADEFALADNQATRLSKWDPDNFKKLVERIRERGRSVQAVGFNDKEVRDIVERSKKAKEESNWGDSAPTKRRTKVGELWQLGNHRLIVGDSTNPGTVQRLMAGRPAQLVFTDPPYGVDYHDSKGQSIKNDKKKRDELASMVKDALANAVAAAASDAAFYIWHAISTREDFAFAMKAAGLEERQYLIWAKPSLVLGRADYQWNHEPCFYASKAGAKPAFYGGRTEVTLWRIAPARSAAKTTMAIGPGLTISSGDGDEIQVTKTKNGSKLRHMRVEEGQAIYIDTADAQGTVWEVGRDHAPEHPNQKPTELARRAIENSTKPGQVVLDVFGGSGSTLAAAEETGRCAHLVELDPKWADGIIARWEKLTGQKAQLA